MCTVTDAIPNIGITGRWVKTDSSNADLHSGQKYIISNIQRERAGTYNCTASNIEAIMHAGPCCTVYVLPYITCTTEMKLCFFLILDFLILGWVLISLQDYFSPDESWNICLILHCQYTEIIKWITELALAFEIFSIGIAIFAEFVYVLQLFCVTICWYRKANVKPRVHYIHMCVCNVHHQFAGTIFILRRLRKYFTITFVNLQNKYVEWNVIGIYVHFHNLFK